MDDKNRLSEIADKLRVASTWVAGNRAVALTDLADELDPSVEVVDKDLDTIEQ